MAIHCGGSPFFAQSYVSVCARELYFSDYWEFATLSELCGTFRELTVSAQWPGERQAMRISTVAIACAFDCCRYSRATRSRASSASRSRYAIRARGSRSWRAAGSRCTSRRRTRWRSSCRCAALATLLQLESHLRGTGEPQVAVLRSDSWAYAAMSFATGSL